MELVEGFHVAWRNEKGDYDGQSGLDEAAAAALAAEMEANGRHIEPIMRTICHEGRITSIGPFQRRGHRLICYVDVEENGGRPQTRRQKLTVVSGIDPSDVDGPQPLVDGFIDQASVNVLVAPPKAGKSLLALGLGAHVSCGRPWHGRDVHAGPVLYQTGEGEAGHNQRLNAYAQHLGQLDLPDFHSLLRPIDFRDVDDIDELLGVVEEIRPALIVVDTLARAMPGAEENSARDMGQVIAAADRLREISGSAFLFLHHTPVGRFRARGSGALAGAVDIIAELRRKDDLLTLAVTEARHHASGVVTRLRIQPTPAGAIVTGSDSDELETDTETTSPTVTEMLATLAEIDTGAGVSTTAWAESSEVKRSTFYRWRIKLLKAGLVSSGSTNGAGPYSLTDKGSDVLVPPIPPQSHPQSHPMSPTVPPHGAHPKGAPVGRTGMDPTEPAS